ncbi:MAG: aminotransferase class IV [Bdellovibrionota bacterium]
MNESVNRAFMYGESVFTTMRLVDGRIREWESHYDRLKKSVEFLYGPFIEGESWHTFLRDRLETRLETEDGDKIVRLTLYREHDRGLQVHGLFSILDLRLHIGHFPYDAVRFEGKRFHLRTVPVISKPTWWPSYLKVGNYLETILAQKKFLGPDDDDILFISHDDTILESSVANIFICRQGKLFTAPAGPNVLEGVMRKRVLEMAHETFISVSETETGVKEIAKVDGVFGTNCIRGLFLITRIDDHEIIPSADFVERLEKLKQALKL